MAFSTKQDFSKTSLTLAWEKFVLNIVRVLLYVNSGSSFYIQVLISKTFRKEFVKIIKKIERPFKILF